MNLGPVRWGKGGHSIESKFSTLLKLVEMLELGNGACRGSLESGKRRERGTPVGMHPRERVEARPRERVEARLHDGGRVGRNVVSNGRGMVPMESSARIPAGDDRNFV